MKLNQVFSAHIISNRLECVIGFQEVCLGQTVDINGIGGIVKSISAPRWDYDVTIQTVSIKII